MHNFDEYEKTDTPIDYNSYAYILALLDEAEKRLETEFHIACSFIPNEGYSSHRKSGVEKAHDKFSERWAKISEARKDFRRITRLAYKNHPNPKMKEFWCADEPI